MSACVPALSEKITQDLSESCFSHLKSALEVPRLYRRTNKVSALIDKNFEVGKYVSGRPEREEMVKCIPLVVERWMLEKMTHSLNAMLNTRMHVGV